MSAAYRNVPECTKDGTPKTKITSVLHDLAKILKDLREQNYFRESFAFPSAFPCAHKKSYTVFQVFLKCSAAPTDWGCSTLAKHSEELLTGELVP